MSEEAFDIHKNEPPRRIERPAPQPVSLEELGDTIDLHYFPTVDEICAREEVGKEGLFQRVRERGQASVAKAKDPSLGDPEEDLLFIFNCYKALDRGEDVPQDLQQLKDSLASYQAYVNTFLDGEAPNESSTNYRWHINNVYRKTNPLDLIRTGGEMYGEKYKAAVYRTKEEGKEKKWVEVSDPTDDEKTYITQDAYDELLELGEPIDPYLDHATSSAALPGITKHRALLSRYALAERGDPVLSGERADVDSRVYVAHGLNYGKQYSAINWWNEFPIDIELNPNAQALKSPAPDHGISLGHEVPIDLITRLYCPKKRKESLQTWVNEVHPQADIVSYEAFLGRKQLKVK